MNRVLALTVVVALAAVAGLSACFKPPEIVMVDRATALEQQAAGSFDDLERTLDRAGIEPRPVPLTPEQLDALGIRPPSLVDESDLTDADRLDGLLAQHCVGEGKDGLIVDTRDACRGAADAEQIQTLVERANRARRQLWRWMHEQRGDVSEGELQRSWRENHVRNVVCGGWIEGSDGQVARKVVLKPCVRAAAGLALAASLVGGRASADNVDDDDLRMPQRLTVGVADDLLGQLGPDGKMLYFVSNRDTTSELFAQSLVDGHAWQLFDDGADVTWPRVSPDGRSLLYISFRESASGQLCVRRLPEGDGRRCLQDSFAALQAEWIDRDRIALVSRQSVQGDLRLLEVTIGSSLSARLLLDRNMTSPAVSPDGRWLVYVPVARTVQTVGPAFAAHAAQALEAIPLASASSAPPAKIVLQLPGQTGQPVFAKDGRSLYVVQFFTDTNHDGTVDASDHGVLFRVPISFTGGTPVAGPPEQLTETSWNCEYPAPFADRLIATCSQDASLDVYSLPLEGEVPAEWTMPMLVNAIDDADTLVEEQLLRSRRLARETTPSGRRRAMLASGPGAPRARRISGRRVLRGASGLAARRGDGGDLAAAADARRATASRASPGAGSLDGGVSAQGRTSDSTSCVRTGPRARWPRT